MANEDKKDFNAMLHDNKDMPKIQTITDQKSIEKYGGDKMYFAPPIDYDKVMKRSCKYSAPYRNAHYLFRALFCKTASWHFLSPFRRIQLHHRKPSDTDIHPATLPTP